LLSEGRFRGYTEPKDSLEKTHSSPQNGTKEALCAIKIATKRPFLRAESRKNGPFLTF
jgi:hypothetical protein